MFIMPNIGSYLENIRISALRVPPQNSSAQPRDRRNAFQPINPARRTYDEPINTYNIIEDGFPELAWICFKHETM